MMDKTSKDSKQKNILSLLLVITAGFAFLIMIFYASEALKEHIIENKKSDQVAEKLKQHKLEEKKRAKRKLHNHIRFLYSLNIKDKRVKQNLELDNSYDYLIPLSNPYPKTFNQIKSYKNDNLKNRLKIENKSNTDLIVFRLVNDIDESVYIPKDYSTFIDLGVKDTIVTYTGNYFKNGKFSHFKKHTSISNLYEINDFDKKQNKSIIILPKINNTKDALKFNNLDVKKLNSINNLYTIYYRKKYKK